LRPAIRLANGDDDMIAPKTGITQGQMDALADLANSKPVYGKPFNFTAGNWKTELQRLRTNITNSQISGPWPVLGTNNVRFSTQLGSMMGGATASSVKEVYFFFASDSAQTQTVSILQISQVHSSDPVFILGDVVPGPATAQTVRCKIKVGGTATAHFRGGLGFYLGSTVGLGVIPTASVETNFPGDPVFITSPSGGGLPISSKICAYFDCDVAPGEYDFTLQCGTDCWGTYGALQTIGVPVWDTNLFHLTATVGQPVPAAGISSSLGVWRIDATPPAADDDALAFGVYSWFRKYPYNDPVYGFWYPGIGLNWEASLRGLWVAKTDMVSNMPNLHGYMPWNPLQATGNNAGDPDPQATPHEVENQPATGSQFTWEKKTQVTAGQYVSGAGAYHRANNNGTTGDSEPTWPLSGAQTVLDGTVTWKRWGNWLPARARYFTMPAWPVAKLGETNPARLPEHYTWWAIFNVQRPLHYFFIWRIRINRLFPQSTDSFTMAHSLRLPVSIGCIRNGNFTSFATYDIPPVVPSETGQWLEGPPVKEMTLAVMWPIFTKDALVYQADEYLDVQAEICSFPSTGAGVTFPILAAHYNDTEALLNQL
jgi:hypothetical protein